MAGSRFTGWFSEGERGELRHCARRLRVSENFLLRLALRTLLYDEKPPQYVLDDLANARNESNGGNDNETVRATG